MKESKLKNCEFTFMKESKLKESQPQITRKKREREVRVDDFGRQELKY